MEYLFYLMLITLFCRDIYDTTFALVLMYNVTKLTNINAVIPIFIILNTTPIKRKLCLLYLLFYYYIF